MPQGTGPGSFERLGIPGRFIFASEAPADRNQFAFSEPLAFPVSSERIGKQGSLGGNTNVRRPILAGDGAEITDRMIELRINLSDVAEREPLGQIGLPDASEEIRHVLLHLASSEPTIPGSVDHEKR